MSVPHRALALAAVLVLALAAAARADTLHVPADHATPQAAVDAAAPGDVIVLAKGTYAGNVLVTGKTDLTLRAQGKVLLVAPEGAPGAGVAITASSRIRVEGLRAEGFGAGVEALDSSEVVVRDGRFADNTFAVRFTEVVGGVIAGNRVLRGGTAMLLTNGDPSALASVDVADNRLLHAAGDGVRLSGSGHRVRGNLLRKCGSGIVALEVDGAGLALRGDDGLVSGNTVKANAGGELLDTGSDNVFVGDAPAGGEGL